MGGLGFVCERKTPRGGCLSSLSRKGNVTFYLSQLLKTENCEGCLHTQALIVSHSSVHMLTFNSIHGHAHTHIHKLLLTHTCAHAHPQMCLHTLTCCFTHMLTRSLARVHRHVHAYPHMGSHMLTPTGAGGSEPQREEPGPCCSVPAPPEAVICDESVAFCTQRSLLLCPGAF